MRSLLFLGGVSILALGLVATRVLDRESGLGFLLGALRLGGGLAISGLFSLRWKLHGVLAGGVLALLGFARGLGNLPSLAQFLAGERSRGLLPVLESSATAICFILLVATVRSLVAARRRHLLEAIDRPDV